MLHLQQTTAPFKIDLIKFCGDDRSRLALSMPWIDGEMFVATNGKILVRCPIDPQEDQ